MTDKFGIEIEFHGFNGYTDAAKEHLNCEVGHLSFKDYEDTEEYEGSSYSFEHDWYVKTDCSVNRGIEITSPPLLFNEQNLKSVKDVVKAITPVGTTSTQCGIHVHVDATFLREFSREKRKDFFKFLNKSFSNVESKFDSLVKLNRRAGTAVDEYNRVIYNSYCKSNKLASFEDVYRDRYHKLNICAYNDHKTIEFRQFHGTFNSDAVTAWVTLCVTFMRNARKYFELNYQGQG